MKKFIALLGARNKEFFRDKGSLGWNFAFPFLVILGFAYGYSGKQQDILKVAVHHGGASRGELARSFLNTPAVQIVPVDELAPAIEKVRRHQFDLLLDLGDEARYWINSSSNKGALAETLLLRSGGSSPGFRKEAVEGKEIRYVDWLVPGMLCMNLMFSSLFGVGYVLVRYRKNGVLKRLNATPVRAFEFLAAQIVSRLFLIFFTGAVFLVGARFMIGMPMNGSWWELAVFLALGASCMISLGLLVASRISSEELAEGVLNILTWPMIFLSGIWFSLDGLSHGLSIASKALPLTHVVAGVRSIMIDGAGLAQLGPELGILAALTAVFFTVGAITFRWS